jgi:hypothetical protein
MRQPWGICVVTLHYTDSYGAWAPINDRIYHFSKGQTKNDLFQEMVDEVLQWGVKTRLGDRRLLLLQLRKPKVCEKMRIGNVLWS